MFSKVGSMTTVVFGFLIFSNSFLFGQQSFINWEIPHVSPIDVTDDGKLLIVNTADNRLEVIDSTAEKVVESIPVGLEPVSVRVRNASEAWVVNHVSDSISVVDLTSNRVVRTLFTGDEPADVVFAGKPERAFVTVSQRNQIAIFDPNNPFEVPTVIEIEGEDPRALATDGQSVFAAIFESGNRTASLSEFTVDFGPFNPYPGDPNPPPNFGNGFSPPIAADLPVPPASGMIIKKNEFGQWIDDNNGDWSNAVDFDLHDHDVAIIDVNTLAVSYATGLMNANMALAVNPLGGVTIVGTDAINEIRFEPNVKSQFVRVTIAETNANGQTLSIRDLNPHLDYSQTTIPKAQRIQSLGDPRGIAWSHSDNRLYVIGMGSNNLIELDQNLNRVNRIPVGEGPTGLVADEDFVYVLNRFEGSVSIIDRLSLSELTRISFYDPTPTIIKNGRPFLYNTHLTSGLGQASCASCHIDARTDKLAWDLGDPQGEVKPFDQECEPFPGTSCEDWHPMKGPLATQTLVGLADTSPFHWRGDRGSFSQFNPAFVGLQGRESELSPEQMNAFEEFIMTIQPTPNPNRNIDSSLPSEFSNGGNAFLGRQLFNTGQLDAPFNCVDCHSGNSGTNRRITPQVLDQQTQSMKSSQLRNLFEKTGRDDASRNNNNGFAFVHDGSFDTLFNFLGFGFNFQNDQQRLDVEAYLMCFSRDFHASIGAQITTPSDVPNCRVTIPQLVAFADLGEIELIAKGNINSENRGYVYVGNNLFQSDRIDETITLQNLLNFAGPGNEVTFTSVPIGTSERMGVDRDEDGFYDHDEFDLCSDPADPRSTPPLLGDVNGDGSVNLLDVAPFVDTLSSGVFVREADMNCDGSVNLLDVEPFVATLSGS